VTNINWQNISDAVEFYKTRGFEYIDTPWIVNYDTLAITCTNTRGIITTDDNRSSYYGPLKGLVGSAEQGFLQLAIVDQLPDVNYVSAGPCFRMEKIDELHQQQFFKVELFSRCATQKVAELATVELMHRASEFMNNVPTAVKTDEGYDLEINGIEVGSYGARYHEKIGWWAYGTGLAEPRYTTAMNKG
jgi:hypothetical protein